MKTLEEYLEYYEDNYIEDPYKQDFYHLRDYANKVVREIGDKRETGTTGFCWLETRLFKKDGAVICNYANKKTLEILDKKVLKWIESEVWKTY